MQCDELNIGEIYMLKVTYKINIIKQFDKSVR